MELSPPAINWLKKVLRRPFATYASLRSSMRVALFTLIVTLVFNSLLISEVSRGFHEAERSAERSALNIGAALTEDIYRQFTQTEQVMRATLQWAVATQVFQKPEGVRLPSRWIGEQFDLVPHLAALIVLDRSGATLLKVETREGAASAATLMYLRETAAQFDQGGQGLFVYAPTKDDAKYIWFARVARDANGAILGTVVASIETVSLLRAYQSVKFDLRGTIALLRPNGDVLAAYADGVAQPVGSDFASPIMIEPLGLEHESPQAMHTTSSAGEQFLYVLWPLKRLDFLVGVGVGERAYLQEWRRRAVMSATTGVLVTAIFCFLAYLHGRELEQRERAAAALANSEARFKDFATSASDWFWEQGPDFKFTYVTNRFSESDDSRNEVDLGKTLWEVNPDGASEQAWRALDEDMRLRKPFRGFRFIRPDTRDHVRHYSISGRPAFDESGLFLGYRGSATDITAIVEADARADRSERILYEAIDAFPEAIAVWDANDRLIMINELFRNLMPDMHRNWIGKSFAEVCGEIAHFAMRSSSEAEIQDWCEARIKDHANPGASIDVRLGKLVWLLVRERRLKDGSIVSLYIDHTERRKTAEALRRSIERYDLAVRQAGIWDWNLVTNKVYHSPRFIELLGYQEQEFSILIAKTIKTIIHPDDLEQALAVFKEHMINPLRPFDIELRMITKDQGYRWFHGRGQSVCDEKGRPVRLAGLITDINERRMVEAELRTTTAQAQIANRAKSEFLANMSHELRTPLNAVLGFSDLLVGEFYGPLNDKQREYLADILSAARHLLEVLNDILDLAKVEAGRYELVEEEVDAADLIEACLRIVLGRAELAGVTVGNRVGRGVTLKIDVLAIKQILLNLLSNAVKFTPRRGSITIAMDEHPDGVQISVTDTGIGIAPDHLANIFDPFQRASGAVSRQTEGTGLGLSISRKLAELHEGNLVVTSEIGQGTKVTLILPAARALRSQVEKKMAAPEGSHSFVERPRDKLTG